MSGWIYAIYSERSRTDDETVQIKFGKSKHHPNRDSLDGRVRKLELSVVALGLGNISHAVEPFFVSDHGRFEKHLKQCLKGHMVKPDKPRFLTEVCRIRLEEFRSIIGRLKEEIG